MNGKLTEMNGKPSEMARAIAEKWPPNERHSPRNGLQMRAIRSKTHSEHQCFALHLDLERLLLVGLLRTAHAGLHQHCRHDEAVKIGPKLASRSGLRGGVTAADGVAHRDEAGRLLALLLVLAVLCSYRSAAAASAAAAVAAAAALAQCGLSVLP